MADFLIRVRDKSGARKHITSSSRIGVLHKIGTVVITDLKVIPKSSTEVGTLSDDLGLAIECLSPYTSYTVVNTAGERLTISSIQFELQRKDGKVICYT